MSRRKQKKNPGAVATEPGASLAAPSRHPSKAESQDASAELLTALAAPFAAEPANGMARLVNSQLALATGEAQRLELAGTLTLLQASNLQPSISVGGGVLLERYYAELDEWLAAGDRVQTCVCLGIPAATVAASLRQYPGTRIDRLVAPGQALAFDWFWDGQDLLAAMSRQTRYH